MRLIVWNCNMGLKRKLDRIAAAHFDIAVISEAAEPERIWSLLHGPATGLSAVWVGDNQNKGLLVLAQKQYALEIDPSHDPANRYILPVRVKGPTSFNLMAVWSSNDRKQPNRHARPGPILRALQSSRSFCREHDLVVAGDFNNNVIWDRPKKHYGMSAIIRALSELGLHSAYHRIAKCEFGKEPEPTIYWRDRKKDGPQYHIDYLFAPEHWFVSGLSVSIGTFEDWCGSGLSDHVPLMIDVDRAGMRKTA